MAKFDSGEVVIVHKKYRGNNEQYIGRVLSVRIDRLLFTDRWGFIYRITSETGLTPSGERTQQYHEFTEDKLTKLTEKDSVAHRLGGIKGVEEYYD
jgi:hypothetical protein